MPNDERVKKVSDAIAALWYEAILKFDREEPEFKCFTILSEEFNETSHLKLLGIWAGIIGLV